MRARSLQLAAALGNLAQNRINLDDTQEARALLTEALEIRQAGQRSEHAETRRVAGSLQQLVTQVAAR